MDKSILRIKNPGCDDLCKRCSIARRDVCEHCEQCLFATNDNEIERMCKAIGMWRHDN